MMDKKILSKVYRKEFTRESLSLDQVSNKVNYIIRAEEIEINILKEKILVMYLFEVSKLKKSKNAEPTYRMFHSHEDYITQDLSSKNVKWLTGCLQNLICLQWYSKNYYIDELSSEIIKKYFDTEDGAITTITDLQRRIMYDRLQNKYKKITDKIDKQMEMVPELPNDFEKWIYDIAFFKSKYIYYKYNANRKKQLGYCTHCKSEVIIENQKHNKSGVCPSCGSQIKYKALGKSKSVVDSGYASIIQKTEKGILLRDFYIKKSYIDDYKNAKLSFKEVRRTFFEENESKILRYEYAEFRQTGRYRWCDYEYKVSVDDGSLYDRNIYILKDTLWKYSAIELMAVSEPGYKFSIYDYLVEYKHHPILEYLVKLKLYNLANDLVNGYKELNEQGKNFEEIFGLSKSYFSLLQKLNINSRGLRIIKRLIKENIKLTEEKITCLCNDKICKDYEIIFNLVKYSKINITIRYLRSQIGKGIKEEDIVTDWRDYLEMCKKLKYDLANDFILYPKCLKEKHDEVNAQMEYKKNKKADNAIKEMYQELLNLYGWEDKKFEIVVPKEAMEIIKEGQKLRHCVGGYLERIQKKETIILFLREKNDIEKSFYTIEVTNNSIVQCRGYKNASYSSEISKVLDKFKNDKLNKLKKVG